MIFTFCPVPIFLLEKGVKFPCGTEICGSYGFLIVSTYDLFVLLWKEVYGYISTHIQRDKGRMFFCDIAFSREPSFQIPPKSITLINRSMRSTFQWL
jgi:hypothetical protein